MYNVNSAQVGVESAVQEQPALRLAQDRLVHAIKDASETKQRLEELLGRLHGPQPISGEKAQHTKAVPCGLLEEMSEAFAALEGILVGIRYATDKLDRIA